jgi:hypothetical protein
MASIRRQDDETSESVQFQAIYDTATDAALDDEIDLTSTAARNAKKVWILKRNIVFLLRSSFSISH